MFLFALTEKWQIKKPIHVRRKRLSQAILKDSSSLKDYLAAKARLSHPHIKNWPYENPSRTMKAERKQNVIIVCNKDKDAHPRKMFNVQNTQVHPLKELHIVCLFVNDELILPSTIEAAKINRTAAFTGFEGCFGIFPGVINKRNVGKS
jgi:hypothetical protein